MCAPYAPIYFLALCTERLYYRSNDIEPLGIANTKSWFLKRILYEKGRLILWEIADSKAGKKRKYQMNLSESEEGHKDGEMPKG